MAPNFYHTKTAGLVCISGQFHQLIEVNKICRSPLKGKNSTTEKENTKMEQLILSTSGYINMFELGIQCSTKVNSGTEN